MKFVLRGQETQIKEMTLLAVRGCGNSWQPHTHNPLTHYVMTCYVWREIRRVFPKHRNANWICKAAQQLHVCVIFECVRVSSLPWAYFRTSGVLAFGLLAYESSHRKYYTAKARIAIRNSESARTLRAYGYWVWFISCTRGILKA
jgi:hypothetical protein